MGRIERWLATLREEQRKSNCRVPMAALVIRGNKVVAKSSNLKGYRVHHSMLKLLPLENYDTKSVVLKVLLFSSDVFVMMVLWVMLSPVLTALKFSDFKALNM